MNVTSNSFWKIFTKFYFIYDAAPMILVILNIDE